MHKYYVKAGIIILALFGRSSMIRDNDPNTGLNAAAILSENDPYVDTVVNGRYHLQSLLGYGGWSMVYRAEDQVLKRPVAVKLLYLPLASDAEKRKRFEQEARAASLLSHANIATVFDFGIMPFGQPYIIMEHLEGYSLSDRIQSQGPIPADEAIEILSQVASALEHAHEKGILHRDIKPSNILITASGGSGNLHAKVLDFGLAKWMDDRGDMSQLTTTGKAVGTPSYMSPEQCRGDKLDVRSDVYSLGCTLYEMLCGVKPFSGNVLDCMHAHLSEDPAPLKKYAPEVRVPVALESVVRKAMAKDKNARMPSVRAFREALQDSRKQKTNALLPLWWRVSHNTGKARKFGLTIAVTVSAVTFVYLSAPAWLPLIGIHSVRLGADAIDPVLLESVISEMESRGEVKEAERILVDSMSAQMRKHGPDTQMTGSTAVILGKYYLRHGRNKDALAPLKLAVNAFTKSDSPAGLSMSQKLLNKAINGVAESGNR